MKKCVRSIRAFLIYIFYSFLFFECSSINVDIEKEDVSVFDEINVNSPEYQKGVEIALKKAEQIATIRWKAVNTIPKSSIYIPGGEYEGLPYSSVKEMDKFVGQEVSFYTFLSATNNPRSVFYTESVSELPYHGKNCSCYYGTVCSMSVNYALGINAPFASNSYKNQSFMKKISDKEIDLLEVADVLASDEHSIMIADVKRKGKEVKEIKYFENSSFKVLERNDFQDYWNQQQFIHYRYADLSNNTYSPVEVPNNDRLELSANRGDKSVYRRGEDTIINILSDSYSYIELYCNNSLLETRKIINQDQLYTGLTEGLYAARLTDGSNYSDYTFFEVINAEINTIVFPNAVTVTFDNVSKKATAAEFCDISGEHLFTKLVSEEENKRHRVTMKKIESEEPYYCKVIFQGQYGKIASERVLVK